MLKKIETLVLKLVFSPCWLFVCCLCLMIYCYEKANTNNTMPDFQDFVCKLFQYWKL